MHVTMRPYATTGIALVGAAVIAVAPVAPPPSEFAKPTSEAAVRLAAAPNPIDFYSGIFDRTVSNAGLVLDNYLDDPLPIIRAIIANQIASGEAIVGSLGDAADQLITVVTDALPPILEAALDDLLALNLAGAVNKVLNAALLLLLPVTAPIGALVDVAVQPLRNLVNAIDAVVNHPTVNLTSLLLAALGPVLGAAQGIADATQNVIDAVLDLDPVGLVYSVVDFPGYIVDGALNGRFSILGLVTAPGLLNPGFAQGDPATPTPGLINWFGEAAQHIAGALEPCCTTMVTLDTEPDPEPAFATFALGGGGVDNGDQGDVKKDEGKQDEGKQDDVKKDDVKKDEEGAEEGGGDNLPGTGEVRNSLNFSPNANGSEGQNATNPDGQTVTEVDPADVQTPSDPDPDANNDGTGEGSGDGGGLA